MFILGSGFLGLPTGDEIWAMILGMVRNAAINLIASLPKLKSHFSLDVFKKVSQQFEYDVTSNGCL